MMKRYSTYLAPFCLFLAFVIDGQISTLLSNWGPERITITCHLLLILAIYFTPYLSSFYHIFLFLMLGIIYDIYYLGGLGIATTLYPLMIYLMYYFYQAVPFNRVINFVVLMVLIFGFEFASFLLARLFQLTNLSMFIFVFYNLLPGLLFNSAFLILLQPLMERSFGIINKT